ncbi:MAG: UvrD-helicase domain-containing protein, partial [Propionibacteriaceae bacterium]|nr:UvrD-helicase domain-containing protein [Propionibacteriaceae bacterium]
MNNATSAHLPDSVMRSTEAESETFIPEIPEFSPSDALPEGTWSLEASAGTGKTHTIAALVSRYLAQGLVDTAGLAVVTFSRSAATVLAERIRARLRQSLNLLAAEPDVINAALTDEFDHAMLACNAAEKKVRENRLRTALAQWDAAQIGTIHEFCEVMLSELGILADSDLSARLVSDLSGLHHQVVSDVYLHRYAHLDRVGFDLKKATELAQAALRVPDALIVPDSGNSDIEERKAFVNNVRAELARRKQLLGIYDHNDQMLRLLQAISGENATAARARLQNKYRVILVDEFQDTDPTQWQILHSCFHGFATMILIGDPKQAIYSFRGADIATYVSATKAASQQRSLRVNYRADAQVISGLNTLFQNLALGEGIAVPQVKASQTQARIRNGGCAVQLRYSTRVLMRVEAARAEITDDLVRQVKLLLAQAQVHQGHWRELRCSDIAILVRSNVYGRNIAQTLSEADIPVAFTGVDSVFDSHPAREWLVLLRALVQPNVNNQRKALMTDFIAASLLDIANASAQQQANWSKQLTDWSTLLSNDGIAALFSRIQTNTSFVEQLASRKLGERDLSDHRHIAQILHAQFEAGIRGLALISWLSEAITSGENNAEWAKKLPTDRDAVQVMTIHRAKGMQFPVVLLPQAADFLLPEPNDAPITTHAVTGERIVDVGGKFGEYRAER